MISEKQTKSITKLNENCKQLIEETKNSKKPLFISEDGINSAVIIDIESYNKLLYAADLNKMLVHKSEDIQPINQSDELIEQS